MDSPPGFPLFPKLASELRLRIVNDSIPLLIPIFKSSSLEHVPHRSREAGLTERFQWKYAFPVLSTPSEEIIVIIDRNIHFLATPPSTFPTQIVFNYDLSATFAPRAPPPINREVNYEFQRRYRVVLDLLPDIHSPVPAVRDTTTARQIIRFNSFQRHNIHRAAFPLCIIQHLAKPTISLNTGSLRRFRPNPSSQYPAGTACHEWITFPHEMAVYWPTTYMQRLKELGRLDQSERSPHITNPLHNHRPHIRLSIGHVTCP